MPQRIPIRLLSSTNARYAERIIPRYSPQQHRQASDLSHSETTPFTSSPPLQSSKPYNPPTSFLTPAPSPEIIRSFNPAQRARLRTKQLPPSRYRFRPPRYYRGPLHPHQPPPPSSPSSRLFIPGPFSLPRLHQTYTSTLRPDLLTLAYTHHPPGSTLKPPQRLRDWDDSSPYHKNRPLRAPRGAPALPLHKRPITFRNVPQLSKITVSSLIRDASSDSAYLHVAGMILQSLTSVRATVHIASRNIQPGRASFQQRAGKPIAVSCTLTGECMYDFLAKCIETVFPSIKEWKGLKGSSGDGSGNLGFGLSPETVGGFPEIAVNYDAYPPKMIPGVDVVVQTTATNDRDARVLLSGLGMPFHGKHVN